MIIESKIVEANLQMDGVKDNADSDGVIRVHFMGELAFRQLCDRRLLVEHLGNIYY